VKAHLTPLAYNRIIHVRTGGSIRDVVQQHTGCTYSAGMAAYQLTKTETIQEYKDVYVRDRASGVVYGGADARAVLGIPEGRFKLTPVMLGAFEVYVQSTSYNRKILSGTNVLVLH
jgi:hypothetical protein